MNGVETVGGKKDQPLIHPLICNKYKNLKVNYSTCSDILVMISYCETLIWLRTCIVQYMNHTSPSNPDNQMCV